MWSGLRELHEWSEAQRLVQDNVPPWDAILGRLVNESSFEVSGACGTICCQLVKEFPRLKQLSVGCLELSEIVSLLQAIPKELKVLKLKIRSDHLNEHAMCIELAEILSSLCKVLSWTLLAGEMKLCYRRCWSLFGATRSCVL